MSPIRLLTVGLIFSLFAPELRAQYVDSQVTESFTEPVEIREVAAAEPGAVARVAVQEGQRVTAGTILAELLASELQQKLTLVRLQSQSESKVIAARARVRLAEKQRDALQPMLEQGHANQAEVEQARLEYEVASAELQGALEKQKERLVECSLIEAEIERRTIRSPIDGYVVDIHARDGEYISASTPSFATIAKISQLRVRFYLHTDTAAQLHKGQVVSLKLGTGFDQDCEGQVHFVSPITDPDSGTTRVDIVIDNPELEIRSGIPCRWDPSN